MKFTTLLLLCLFTLASWPSDIYSDDPRIIGGLDALVSAGIIDEARRAEIVAK